MTTALVPYRKFWRDWAERMTGVLVEDHPHRSMATFSVKTGEPESISWWVKHLPYILFHEMGHVIGKHGKWVAERPATDSRLWDYYPHPYDRKCEREASLFGEEMAHTLGHTFDYQNIEQLYKQWPDAIPEWRYKP